MKVSATYRRILRIKINKNNRSLLKNKDFSIIASNCVGGVITHELGLRFNTPTVNMYFEPQHFVRFCQNLPYYLNYPDFREVKDLSKEVGYPVIRLDDIVIHMVHYRSAEEAEVAWKRRAKRVNYNNLFLILVDRDGCDPETMREFDKLPYKHKAFLSYKENPEISCNVCIPDSEVCVDNQKQVRDLCQYQSKFTGLRWLDKWDYVRFLNEN